MCSSAIIFIILKISDVFLRYRSIAGKHIKNRPHTLQCFADYFAKCVCRFSRLAVLSPPPTPTQFFIRTCLHVLQIYALQAQQGVTKRCRLTLLSKTALVYEFKCESKIREKYIKKILRIVLDYRCILQVLRKNHTCVVPVSIS
jgi:hypothetical protein